MKLLATAAPASIVCPMHPDVVSDKAAHCPKCGMKLLPAALVAQTSQHGEHLTTATESTVRPVASSGKTTWST
jgi:hypothetical protein